MPNSVPLLDQLRAICGLAHVLTAEDPATDLSPWEQDWRKRVRGRALAVVRPASTAQVAEVVKACTAHRTPIVPQGGNTGLVVGGVPDASGQQIVLSMARMNAVRAIDPDNLTLTVEAGCVLQQLQGVADQAGLLFPLSLGAEGSCTIGGNLGTNAGGTQVVRYGNTRELCLGLAHQRLGPCLTGFEVMGQFALSLVDKHYPQLRVPLWQNTPWCVLLENSDNENEAHARSQFETLLETALEQGCVTDAVVAENLSQAQSLWHIRESITLAQAAEGLNIKHDISIPVSRIPAFVAETDALLAREFPGVRMVDFGHLGDGNLHYNVQAPEGVDGPTFLREYEERVNTVVFEQVKRFDGSISAEHGVGALKAGKLPHYKDPTALAMMRAVKQALDPDNLLNPGRVLV
jgi:FAD/FMN-containing dehydrogenase